MDSVPLGIVIAANEEQFLKALYPIFVTLLGMVMEVREEQLQKASAPIPTTL